MKQYETKGGYFSEGETHMKILDLMAQLQEQLNILGHYKKENSDELIGQGYLAVAELMQKITHRLRMLAVGRLH